jgi:hypothetical protein
MARDRKARMTTGSKYVAIGALTELLNKVGQSDAAERLAENSEGQPLAEWIVSEAWDVEHFPVAGKVQITLDVSALDRADEHDQQND